MESNLYRIADNAIIKRRAPKIKLPIDDKVKSHFLKFNSPFFFSTLFLSNICLSTLMFSLISL